MPGVAHGLSNLNGVIHVSPLTCPLNLNGHSRLPINPNGHSRLLNGHSRLPFNLNGHSRLLNGHSRLLNGHSRLPFNATPSYAYGVVLWEIVAPPKAENALSRFSGYAAVGAMEAGTVAGEVPEWVDAEYARLVDRCWSTDAASRPTFEEMVEVLEGVVERSRGREVESRYE